MPTKKSNKHAIILKMALLALLVTSLQCVGRIYFLAKTIGGAKSQHLASNNLLPGGGGDTGGWA